MKQEKDGNGDTRHPHAMLCAAAGVATGEQVPTSPGHVSTLSIHYLYTIQPVAAGDSRYHNSFYTQANY